MVQKISPFIEGKYGWDFGEGGWNTGMDENLLKFSFLFDSNIDGIVDVLPQGQSGKAYYLTPDKRVFFYISGLWYSTPIPNWFQLTLRETGQIYRFTGTSLIPLEQSSKFVTQENVDAAVLSVAGEASKLEDSLADTESSENGAAKIGRNAQIISSVTALRGADKNAASKFANVLGYTNPGDGGGGLYFLDAADTSSLDNGGTIIVATDGGVWKLISSSQVSVKVFGAIGDGASNDTDAIQRATYYCSLVKTPLVFPAGTYKLGSHLDIPSNSYWVGSGSAKVYIPSNCDLTGAPNYGGGERAIHNSAGVSNIRFEGLEFYSDGNTGDYGVVAPTIALLQVSGLTVEDCIFRNFGDVTHYAQGLIAFGCADVTIKGSRFIENSGDGAACAEGGSNIRFLANTASNNGDWGFALSNGVVGAQVIGNTFEYNVSTATGADECSEVSFIGNRSKGNEHGIRIAKFVGPFVGDQFDIVISGNVSISDQFGISVESASYFSVTGNTVRASTEQGIRISASSEGTVSGNSVIGSGLENIILNDGSAGVTVAANTAKFGTYGIRQVGSAPNPHLIAADNQISAASVAPVAGITYKADSLHLGPGGKPYFSGAPSIDSGTVSLTATVGGASLPEAPWGFIPIQVGNEIKKIPVYNP